VRRWPARSCAGDPTFPSGLYWKPDYQADDGWRRRAAVLAIKEAAAAQDRRVPGFAVCQAVISGGVASLEEFDRWVAGREGASGQRPQA
jgi:hypothetical protein